MAMEEVTVRIKNIESTMRSFEDALDRLSARVATLEYAIDPEIIKRRIKERAKKSAEDLLEQHKKIAADTLTKPYTWIVIPYYRHESMEPNYIWSAKIKEFPGCFADGQTAEEAIRNLERAAISWLLAAQEQEIPIPPPTGDAEEVKSG